MSTRKAPSQSATLFKKGTIKKGNDGNKWVIVTNTRGVQRWQKVQVQGQGQVQVQGAKAKTRRVGRVGRQVFKVGDVEDSVWGKNKPLEEFWRSLASGKKVVLIQKSGGHKMFTMPTGKMTARKMFNAFDDDPNIVAVLSSNMSSDAYEVFLYPKARDKSVEYVIKNYKKFFKSAGPMPADLVAKGIPAQVKVLLPA